jgi:hypothetical protein
VVSIKKIVLAVLQTVDTDGRYGVGVSGTAPGREGEMRIGIDLGRSEVRACTANERLRLLPAVAELKVSVRLRAHVPGDCLVRKDGPLEVSSWHVTSGGTEHLVGREAMADGLPGRAGFAWNKTTGDAGLLVLAAVSALCPVNAAEVCVTLPYPRFRWEVTRFQGYLQGEHKLKSAAGNRRSITLQCQFIQDLVGLWTSFVVPDSRIGPDPIRLRGRCLVMDFGDHMVQVGTVANLRFEDTPRGILRGARGMWSRALRSFNCPRTEVPEWQKNRSLLARRILDDGQVTVGDTVIRREDVEPLVACEAERSWPEISASLDAILGSTTHDWVVVGGGAAALFREQLRERFGDRLTLLEDRFAAAEGGRRFLDQRHHLGEFA